MVVVSAIFDRLRVVDLQEADEIVALLTALETIGERIPTEFRQRARSEKTAWQVTPLLEARRND